MSNWPLCCDFLFCHSIWWHWRDARLSWPSWLVTYPPKTVTHPSTNCAQHRVTSLMHWTLLTTMPCFHSRIVWSECCGLKVIDVYIAAYCRLRMIQCYVFVDIVFTVLFHNLPSVPWRCWLGSRKGIWPVKNRVVGCWCGCLSGARCRLAYGPADATATHCLLLQ